jgi:hypothetical protein
LGYVFLLVGAIIGFLISGKLGILLGMSVGVLINISNQLLEIENRINKK